MFVFVIYIGLMNKKVKLLVANFEKAVAICVTNVFYMGYAKWSSFYLENRIFVLINNSALNVNL